MPRLLVVLGAVAIAVVVNLAVYGLGRAAGGSFRLTTDGQAAEVGASTVAGFTAVPLFAGLALLALLHRVPWVHRIALVVAPVLAIGTIPLMTLPADLDGVSTVALAACHVTLAPIAVLAILRLAKDSRTLVPA